MVGHEIVRNRDRRGSHDRIDKPIGAIRQRTVIDPHMASSKYRNPVAIAHRPPPEMPRGASNHRIPARLTIMDVDSMDDYVRNVLYRNAGPAGDVHARATAVDCFETVHD